MWKKKVAVFSIAKPCYSILCIIVDKMNSLQYRIISFAAFFGLTSVIMGAFSSHLLKGLLTAKDLENIVIGVRYQMYHTLALFFLVLLYGKIRNNILKWVYYLFVAGILCFSFSLYAISILGPMDVNIPKFIFFITPLGGVLLIGGWLLLLFNGVRHLYMNNRERKHSD